MKTKIKVRGIRTAGYSVLLGHVLWALRRAWGDLKTLFKMVFKYSKLATLKYITVYMTMYNNVLLITHQVTRISR